MKDLSEVWRIEIDGEDAAAPTVGLAVDIDPRHRVITLGVRILTGGAPALWHGAVARRFFEGERADWTEAAAWLDGAEGRALLEAISHGYVCEMLWSGDWSAAWSEAALASLEALHRGLGARLAGPSEPEI